MCKESKNLFLSGTTGKKKKKGRIKEGKRGKGEEVLEALSQFCLVKKREGDRGKGGSRKSDPKDETQFLHDE